MPDLRDGVRDHEPISPELVLIDPALRRRLLETPHHASWCAQTPHRAVAQPQSPPIAKAAAQPSLGARAASLVSAARSGFASVRSRRIRIAVTVAMLLFAAISTFYDRNILDGAVGRGQQAKPAATRLRTAAASLTRFAWAPAGQATAYDVAFFRSGVCVFRTRTRTPKVEIGVNSATGLQIGLLNPGAYVWYVWPVRDGERDSVAIVDAKFVIDRLKNGSTTIRALS